MELTSHFNQENWPAGLLGKFYSKQLSFFVLQSVLFEENKQLDIWRAIKLFEVHQRMIWQHFYSEELKLSFYKLGSHFVRLNHCQAVFVFILSR
jgi:hypothetical protein